MPAEMVSLEEDNDEFMEVVIEGISVPVPPPIGIGEMVCLSDPDNDEFIEVVIEGIISEVPPEVPEISPPFAPPKIKQLPFKYYFSLDPARLQKDVVPIIKTLVLPDLLKNSTMEIKIEQIRFWAEQQIKIILERVLITETLTINMNLKSPKLIKEFKNDIELRPSNLSSEFTQMIPIINIKILQSKSRQRHFIINPVEILSRYSINKYIEEPDLYAIKIEYINILLEILNNPELYFIKKKRIRELLEILNILEDSE